MNQISAGMQHEISQLRKEGFTHRQIAKKLGIAIGTAYLYCRGIKLSTEQKAKLNNINFQKSLGRLSFDELSAAGSKGGKSTRTHFPKKYTKDILIGFIQEFHSKHDRIPTKAEFVHTKAIRTYFGSWNNGILAAGYSPNPVMFAKKYVAKDGHKCDSLAEKIIDDWLDKRQILHLRNVRYLKNSVM